MKIVEIEADQLAEPPFCQVILPSKKNCKQTAHFVYICIIIFSDDEDNDSKAVTMKDDILTAVTDFNPKPGKSINK